MVAAYIYPSEWIVYPTGRFSLALLTTHAYARPTGQNVQVTLGVSPGFPYWLSILTHAVWIIVLTVWIPSMT